MAPDMHHLALLSALLALLLHASTVSAAGSITLSPDTLTVNGQLINITWSGIPVVGNPTTDRTNVMYSDTIALVQSDAPFGSRWPIKYIWVSQTAPTTFATGAGAASFFVNNHRQDLTFLYLRYPSIDVGFGKDFAWGNQTILARATLRISPALAKAPNQLRLSLLGFEYNEPPHSNKGKKKKGYKGHREEESVEVEVEESVDADLLGGRSYGHKHHHKHDHDDPSDYPDQGPGYDPYHSLFGRDIQITWQSSLAGGIAVISRYSEELESFKQQLLLEYPSTAQGLEQAALQRGRLVTLKHAQAETYTAAEMCGFPANSTGWLDPGFNNYAVWRRLQHNTRYYYFVGSGESGFSSTRSFTTPPLTAADCHCSSYDEDCNTQCQQAIAPLRLLLAADTGTNNHMDGTWSADGQGFYTINAAQSYGFTNVTGVPGPIWPGRTYATNVTIPGVGPYEVQVPYSNIFYSLYGVADFPAWGQQPSTYYVSRTLNAIARTGRFHGSMIVGDLAYAEGMSAHWDMFLSDFEETFSSMPSMFAEGNHESADDKLPEDGLPPDPESAVPDSGGECGIVYEKRMRMPTPPSIPASERPEYYSYVTGPIAVIVLSTEQKWAPGSLQYTWLVSQFEMFAKLRARGRFPWLWVAFHRPMYVDDPDISVGLGNQWVASLLLADLEPLFAKYQVDMTWTGHTHFYHRSCPVLKGGCRPEIEGRDGNKIYPPVHIMVGNGGFQPGASIFNETPPWIAVESFAYGFCTVEATATQLDIECVDVVNGTTIDRTSLSKPAGWRPSPDEAAQYYASLTQVPNPPGVNITAELGPAQQWFIENLANITIWAKNDTNALEELGFFILAFFGDNSAIGKLINAVPGSETYNMAQVSPLYFGTTFVLNTLDTALPPYLKNPAAEEILYILDINAGPTQNTTGGRLWKILNGVVPK